MLQIEPFGLIWILVCVQVVESYRELKMAQLMLYAMCTVVSRG